MPVYEVGVGQKGDQDHFNRPLKLTMKLSSMVS